MTVRYSITYEFDTRPPVTHHGMVTATTAATCMARAAREAQRTLSPRGWSSMVCVLLERLDSDEEGQEESEDQGDTEETTAGTRLSPPGEGAGDRPDGG